MGINETDKKLWYCYASRLALSLLDSESVFKLKVLVRIVGTKKRKTNFRATFLQKFIFVFAQVGLIFFFLAKIQIFRMFVKIVDKKIFEEF